MSSLDDVFRQWYDIHTPPMYYADKNIDRIFYRRGEKKGTTVQYVIEDDLFIEVFSTMDLSRYGWAWTSSADIIVYAQRGRFAYVFHSTSLREKIRDWSFKYGWKLRDSDRGVRVGIPVEESELSSICLSVIPLSTTTSG